MGGSLAKMWHRSLLMLPVRAMLLASRGMFREQDEALAQLQKLNALARFVCLSCGVCAGLRFGEIVALSTHISDSTVLVLHPTQNERSRFPDFAEKPGGMGKISECIRVLQSRGTHGAQAKV